jgi:outer membrane protein TolC
MQVKRIMRLIIMIAIPMTAFAAGLNDANDAKQEPNPNEIGATVQHYLRYAALNNSELKAAFEQWREAVKNVPDAGAILDPKLTYGYYITEETRTEEERQRVGLSQKFGLFGQKEAQQSDAQTKAEAARLKYEATKLKLFWEVKEAFYEFAYLTRATEIIMEHIAAIEVLDADAQASYGWTTADRLNGLLLSGEMIWLESKLWEFNQAKSIAAVKLNTVLNRDKNTDLAISPSEEFEPVQINHTIIIDVLRRRNPQLAQLSKEIEMARNKAKLAKTQSYPDIGIGVDFIRTERSKATGIRPYEKDPVFLTFSIDVPLGKDGLESAQWQAEAQAGQKEQERIEQENSILAEAVKVIYDYEDSISRMQIYKQGILTHGEPVKASQTRYEIFKQGIARLISTRRVLLSCQLRYERAMADNRQRLAELEMLTGAELD